MRRYRAFVSLVRLRHTSQVVGIVTALSVASHGFSVQSLYAVVSSFFLCIAVFLFDDANDHESDKIAHPQRVIPRMLVTVRQAYLVGTVFLFMGILLASILLFHQFSIYLISTAVAMMVIFLRIKPLPRAFLNAFLMWSLFPFAAYIDLKTVLFGLMVALPHVGGSIAKDFVHFQGDSLQKLDPPQVWSKYVASVSFFLAGFILWLPLPLGFVGWLYIPPTSVTYISCLILGFKVLKGHFEKVYVYGAIGMLSSLIAFLISAF